MSVALKKWFDRQSKTKRSFTDAELKTLLNGKPSQTWLLDCVRILALSGMRVGELATLKVADCADDLFRITNGKTAAASRVVPGHSALKELVAGRMKDKAPADFLIHELPTPKPGSKVERSMPVTKHFGRYLQALGLHEQVAGQRQARATLHSLRKWFITAADRAKCRRDDIERTVGHKPQGMSLGVYSEGMTLEQCREVVEAVRLPE